MEVLIVAKTKWGAYFCIGGIELQTNKFIRLMDLNGGYQPSNTPFKVGQIWDISYIVTPGKPPHIEDVKISVSTYISTVNPNQYIIDNFDIWEGDLSSVYDSKLKWENGSGFLNDPNNVPVNSVGFWKSDRDLILNYSYYTYKYNLPFKREKKLPYKGTEKPILLIPAGTLIRLSLAKWWPKDRFTEDRCYLQLSGWYN
jgi:hypothetical protein